MKELGLMNHSSLGKFRDRQPAPWSLIETSLSHTLAESSWVTEPSFPGSLNDCQSSKLLINRNSVPYSAPLREPYQAPQSRTTTYREPPPPIGLGSKLRKGMI